jgi:hypothetical protein
VTLPSAVTLATLGAYYTIINNNSSSFDATINRSGGTLLYLLPAGGMIQVYLIDNTTIAGVWFVSVLAPGITQALNNTFSTSMFTVGTPLTAESANFGTNGATGAVNMTPASGSAVSLRPSNGSAAYNFNLPISAGTSGQLLTSGAGGASAMTWTSLNFLPPSTVGTTGQVLTSSAGGVATWTSLSVPIIQNLTATSGAGAVTFSNLARYHVVEIIGGGAGGQASPASVAPTAGGTSTLAMVTGFTGSIIANGGSIATTSLTGGAGATAATQTLAGTTIINSMVLQGCSGGAWGGYAITNGIGGYGGNTPFFNGGASGQNNSTGQAGTANTGGGGSGAASGLAQTTGGSGGGSGGYTKIVFTGGVTATATFTMGAGGAAGTGVLNGGAGGSGRLIVTSYFQ